MSERFKFTDISAEVYGKYQFCTQNKADGLFYADSDMVLGRPRKGALPSPHMQDTPELTAKARAMHEAAALETAQRAINAIYHPPEPEPQHIRGWIFAFFCGVVLIFFGIIILHVLAAEYAGPLP